MNPEQVDQLIDALREISFSTPGNGKGALESISLALAGPGDPCREGESVAHALRHIADSISDLAEAIRERK